MPRLLVLIVALVCAVVATPAAQRKDNSGQLLLRYVSGERDLVVSASLDYKTFLESVGDQVVAGLPGPPERARRATAAFVLEAASARLGAGDVIGSRALIEWACTRVRGHLPADDFDQAWHVAALSVVDGFLDPVALETHVQHTRAHWPNSAALALSWALAAEQRSSPLLANRVPNDLRSMLLEQNQARIDAATSRAMDDAHQRFEAAEVAADTSAEAHLRRAHLYLQQHDLPKAIEQLSLVEGHSREGWTVYLGRLFRGQAQEQLGRHDEALASYRHALTIGPGGQTATMSLASLLYRNHHSDEAETLVRTLLAETDPISDPWWTYWAGSARLWTSRLNAMRGLIE